MDTLIEKAKKIQLLALDVDGVLTPGNMSYGKEGIESKHFNAHDGQGMRHLLKTGIHIAIITACKSPIIKLRMEDLGVMHVYQQQSDKLLAYEKVKQQLNLTDEQIAYVGDDLPDLPILSRAGFAITVASAPKIMQQYVHWTTQKKGGKGAAREVCDFIMMAQGTYQTIVDSYLPR